MEREIDGTTTPALAERDQLLHELNDTRASYPADQLVHELFEQQAERMPDAIAVVHEGQSLTYAELNRKANRLARYLLTHGIAADHLVGVCVGRSLDMVVGLLGILKAGAAYVPLDPSYPPERLQYMLEDAAPTVVLTQEHLRATLPTRQAKLVDLNSKLQEISGYGGENLQAAKLGLSARSLVYVIYTSGSTGRPKGTAMPHGAMVNLMEWHRNTFGAGAGRRVLQFAALSFDVAFQETFSTLCTGGTLVLLSEWVRRDVRALVELLRNQQIERLFVPPLMLQSLAECLQGGPPDLGSLRDVITAGEQLRVSPEITALFRQLGGCRLHNHYGPTETHVVTALTLAGDPDTWPTFPSIGRPIANTQTYVLDDQRQPVKIGAVGEIYIGGAGVARGYLRQPELTDQRFVADPFSVDSHARLYKTGDLGRWRADGMLEYLGRNDDQVKIRGFRVELGEIEAQLARHEQVREAAVIAREDVPGQKRLVAYVTQRGQSDLDADVLHSHLQAALPEHMVPSAFVVLDSLPLTPSGKLDRRALPAPDLSAYVRQPYEAPQGEVEETLAEIWQDLLGVERVGRHDNFLSLGGHSLLIVRMMERSYRAGLSVDVQRAFQSASLADLASTLVSETVHQFDVPPNLIPHPCEVISPQMLPLVELEPAHIEHVVRLVPGGAGNIQDIYPLTALQEGILFHHLLDEKDGDTYVLLTLLSISSRERLEELVAALQSVIDRHDILRTAVLWEQLPRPIQVVYRDATLPVEEIALDRNLTPQQQIEEWLQPQRQRMDLTQAPLMRLQVAEDMHSGHLYALLQVHHMVDDDVSLQILVAEAVAHLQGGSKALPEPVPYRNHVARALMSSRRNDSTEFFRAKLADVDEPTLPFGLADVRGGAGRIVNATAKLDLTLGRRTLAQARRLSVSPAALFHAAWALVVARTSGRDDIVFGSVLLGRMQEPAEAQRIVGMFINTLPLRLRLTETTASELVRRTQRELVDLLSHEQASLAAAQRCSGVGGSSPLFSAVLNYRHSERSPESEWGSAAGIRFLTYQYRTNYPISLSVDDLGGAFVLTAHTDRHIDAQRVLGYARTALQSLIDALERAPRTPALALEILPDDERRKVIEQFNATRAVFPHERLIHGLFEDQVRLSGDQVAVVFEKQSLTYAELNSRANQLARYLQDRGVGPDQLVGICLERGLDLVVGLLGVLKAGGAYVPLDPDYPRQRLAQILSDAGPRVLLTQRHLKERLPGTAADVIELDNDWNEIASRSGRDLDSALLGLRSSHLAYVIYTSGSTGQPKGVMVEHRNVVSLWQGLENVYRQSPGCQRVALNASINFDASVKQIIQLLSGRTLYVVPQQIRWDAPGFLNFLDENRVDGVDCTPSQLKSWIAAGLLEDSRCQLRLVLVGGEAIDPALWSDLARSDMDFYNVYGPTESTVDATFACLKRDTSAPHIGRPMENRQIYVLDRRGQPVPIGVAGEIYIGGAGVARGYLNRPEQNAERFHRDPFNADPSARIYRTGDSARWRVDGTLEYLGRNDRQVKIRGHRIELGEIETQLMRHAQVREAVVLVREDTPGEKRLVGYVVEQASNSNGVGGRKVESAPAAEHLRSYLKARLPEYMVPVALVGLEKLPLTVNGKLDWRALPAPDREAYAQGQYEPPLGEMENFVAGLWQQVLGASQVGRHDDFFDLGGHSLLAMQVAVRIRAALSIAIPVTWLFQFPTVQQFSARVDEVRQGRLLRKLEEGGHEIEELLARVSSMSEGAVRKLVQELAAGGSQ